jgi:hypothetical protein
MSTEFTMLARREAWILVRLGFRVRWKTGKGGPGMAFHVKHVGGSGSSPVNVWATGSPRICLRFTALMGMQATIHDGAPALPGPAPVESKVSRETLPRMGGNERALGVNMDKRRGAAVSPDLACADWWTVGRAVGTRAVIADPFARTWPADHTLASG